MNAAFKKEEYFKKYKKIGIKLDQQCFIQTTKNNLWQLQGLFSLRQFTKC